MPPLAPVNSKLTPLYYTPQFQVVQKRGARVDPSLMNDRVLALGEIAVLKFNQNYTCYRNYL